jgi:hypothetical protein
METTMEHDELDRLLSEDDMLIPSSGFAAAVMNAVLREAAMPTPLPFPWKRALPGIVGGAITLIGAICGGAVMFSEAQVLPPDAFERMIVGFRDVVTNNSMSWLAAATFVATLAIVITLPAMLSERLLSPRNA